MDMYNVIWTTPSKDSSGSMPLGNGDIGLNVWVEEGGDLLFYISKTDAWDENARLVKLGRIRVKLEPNLFRKEDSFVQTLKLRQGEIEIRTGEKDAETVTRVWVDANLPVVRVESRGAKESLIHVSLELWRDKERPLQGTEIDSAYGMDGSPEPIIVHPDTVADTQGDRITWYHRNTTSIWPKTLELQGMGGWTKKESDPLLNRTFGGLIKGDGLEKVDSHTLRNARPSLNHNFSIYILTDRTDTPEEWLHQMESLVHNTDKVSLAKAKSAHLKWWNEFWNRSWIRITDKSEGFHISQSYTLQRFISACAGRGEFPIKFNGSIFTVDSREPGEIYDADYRRWGGPYWFQNTRLAYWPMLASGDYEMMLPLFRMYHAALPLLKARTIAYFAHKGAYFPETMYFWGAYANSNYGWNRSGKDISQVNNTYIRWHFNGTLELLAIMLDYWSHTQDQAFLKDELLPLADDILLFWDKHYGRDGDGKLLMHPAQALETYQNVSNPTPDIAGLTWVLDELLKLPEQSLGTERVQRWHKLKNEVPPVPTVREGDKTRILPAGKVLESVANCENPELYAVYPFRIFGIGKPDVEIGRETFAKRMSRDNFGWQQNDTQAAFLGLTDEAKKYITQRLTQEHPSSRFPAFWGPNYDWIPDQDHGTNGLMALQTMLLQADNGKIILLPAWPKGWDVEFKLHAPQKTTVEGVYRSGKLESLRITPKARMKDIVVMEPQ